RAVERWAAAWSVPEELRPRRAGGWGMSALGGDALDDERSLLRGRFLDAVGLEQARLDSLHRRTTVVMDADDGLAGLDLGALLHQQGEAHRGIDDAVGALAARAQGHTREAHTLGVDRRDETSLGRLHLMDVLGGGKTGVVLDGLRVSSLRLDDLLESGDRRTIVDDRLQLAARLLRRGGDVSRDQHL